MAYSPTQFSENYQLAHEAAIKEKPEGGLNEFNIEENLLKYTFRPLLPVASGHVRQAFVDYLRTNQYFETIFQQNLFVGQLRTRLGIPNWEHKGLEGAARARIHLIINKNID